MKKLILLLCVLITANAFGQVPSYVPSNGLISWYPFNGNANDESGNGHNGTVNGATLTSDRFGNGNSAYDFNGIDNSITLPLNLNGALLNLTQLTFSCYVNIPTISGGGGIFSNWKDFPLTDPFGFLIGLTLDSLAASTNGGTSVRTETRIYNQWIHVVSVFDGSQNSALSRMKLFINGIQVGTDSSGLAYSNVVISDNLGNSATNTEIGRWWSQFGWIGYFNGKIDDIGIWNRALTQQEITNLYNGSLPTTCTGSNLPLGLSNGLMAWYPFCGNANDESGNGHNGTVNGATLTSDRFGNGSSAYSFDGMNDTITLNLIQQNISTYSISAWFKTTIGGPILSGERDNITTFGKRCLTLDVGNSSAGINQGKVIYRADGPGTAIGQWSNSVYDDNMWHHVTGVFSSSPGAINPNQFLIYIDGILASSTSSVTDTANSPINNNLPILIGAHYVWTDGIFDGILDDIGIWNRALTQQEITNLYNAGICYQTVTVTDTLIINANITGFNPIAYQNSIKVYPNPTNDHITIDCGTNYNTLNGYSMRIDNLLGQTVYTTSITQQTYYIDLNTWTGNGVYLIYLLNDQGTPIDVKKIVIQ